MPDFDAGIKEAIENDDSFKAIIKNLTDAIIAQKNVQLREPCPKCGCGHIRSMKVPDLKLQLEVAEFLTNRGVGRPSQAEGGSDAEKITFIRQVNK